MQAFGRHQQLLRFFHGFSLGKGLKHRCGFQTDGAVRRHEGQVGVEPGSLFVVVAGVDLGEILGFSVFPAGHEAQLTVHLEAVQTINHLTARLLQPPGPLDVVLLVKAGLELHQRQHAFAVFRRFDQAFDDFAVPRHPVQGHFDGDHIGVAGRLLKEVQKGLHALVGVGQQLITLPDLGDHRAAGAELGRTLRKPLFKEQLRALTQDVLNLKQEA